MKRSKQTILVVVTFLLLVAAAVSLSYAQGEGDRGTPTAAATSRPSTPEPTRTKDPRGFSLQATVDVRPPSTNLGTWIIGGVQVLVNETTLLATDNGPLVAGACVTLTYRPGDGGNIALRIVSEPLSVCGFSQPPTATPNLERTWQGRIILEGRADYSGANIFMSEAACSVATFDQPLATTDATGSFKITARQNYQCLRASKAAYLSIEKPLLQPNIGQLKLLAGDVNGDGVINILDIAAIAASFDSGNKATDINADGIVDIFDIVLAAKNYQR